MAVRNLEEPVDLFYVDSLIMKPDPDVLAKLALFKLNKPDASNINLRATCCGAVLCTENQEFHVPHTMATFNNLRPFLTCGFSDVPASTMYVFTKDWPEERRESLASRDRSAAGKMLPQIFDPRSALEEKPILELIAALGAPPRIKSEHAISFAQLCEGMEVTVENGFFDEARAHLSET